jgi:hypothetical protein
MATFQAQVEGVTQLTVVTTPTTGELTQFLTDGVKEVINRIISIRPDEASKFSISSSDSTNAGIAVEGQVISVVREHDSASILRPCSPIDPGNRYESTDVDSLRYRSKYNPGFYQLNGKIFLVPVAATSNNAAIVTQVNYPTVAFGDSSIGASYKVHIDVTATAADPSVFTTADTNSLVNGDIIKLSEFTQMTEVNGMTGTVEGVSSNNFNIKGVSADPAETSIASDVGGTVETVVAGFPDEYEYLVVLYASLRTVHANMGAKTITDQSLTPVLPDIPTVPNFTFTVTTSLPTYTSPTQTINAINWTTAYPDQQANIDTALAKVTTSLNAIDALGLVKLTLDAFSITAVTPDIPTIPNFIISPTVSLPTYTKLITSYDPGTPTDLSVSNAFSQTVTDIAAFTGITAVVPDNPSFETVNFTGAGADASVTVISTTNANVTSLADIGEGVVTLPTAPTYVPPAPPDRPDFESSVTDEDTELVGAKVQQYSADLSAYQAEIGDAVNEFNEANVLYQAGMQKALADAQQDNGMILQSLQKNLTIAQADASATNTLEQTNKAADMQNAVNEMQEIMNQNTVYLQEWQQNIAQYQAEAGIEVQDYQTKLAKYSQEVQKELTIWQQERQGEIQEHGQKIARFQALVADELNVFNTGLQKYQAEVTVMLQEAQYEQQAEHTAELQQYQAEVTTYGAEVNAETQEYIQYLGEQNQEFASAVQTYATLIQTAQAFAAEIQMRLAPRTVEIQEYQVKISEALNSFNAGLQKYQAELEKELEEARYEQQAEHASQLQQYQAEIAAYQTEVASAIQEYQNNLQADQAEYTWLQDQYTRIKAEYDASFIALTPQRQQLGGQVQPQA